MNQRPAFYDDQDVAKPASARPDWEAIHQRARLKHLPVSVVIDAEGNIVHAVGNVRRYVMAPDGEATHNLLDMLPSSAQAQLGDHLRTRLQSADDGVSQGLRLTVTGGHVARVHGLQDAPGTLLVLFEDHTPWQPSEPDPMGSQEIVRLRQRLGEAEAKHDQTSHLLSAGNEALQTFNEELQSTAAELQASQDELRSSNQQLREAVGASQVRVQALAGANSDMQNLMDATAIATVFLDRGFRITRYTPAAATLFKLTPNSVGHTLGLLALSLRYEELEEDAAAVIARLAPIEREVGHDSSGWFLARLLPYRTLEDHIAGVVVSFIDITQRKRAEEVSQWLSAVVASSMDAIVSFSLEGMVLSWNAGAHRLFGYHASEMVGHSIERLADAARLDESLWILERVRERNSVEGLNTVRRAKDGSALQVALTASPVIDGAGHVVGGAVSVRDVGDARRADEALRRSEERLRLVIENARDYAIFSTDLDRLITSWNRGAERLLGYAERDALGRSGDLIFTKEDQALGAPQQEALTALRDMRAADERFHVRSDGSRFWANGTLMRMDDDAGNALGFVKILRDETASREAKAALEQSQAELLHALQENQGARTALEAADAAKDRFIAVLSHELRNPLASMLSAAEVMNDIETPAADKGEAAAIVRRQALTMKALLDDLLDVSRLTANRFELKLRYVDLNSIIALALETLRPLMRSMGHRLHTEIPSTAVMVYVDDVRIGQVLVNLLTNAAKYTPASGEIFLFVAVDASALRLTVRDNGVGMPPEDIERMFDLYTQGAPLPRSLNEGLGVGLALVRNIVNMHSGTVRGSSKGPGQGSMFEVVLPLHPRGAARRPEGTTAQTTRALTILVADDNRDAAWSLAKLLQRDGHQILIASGGNEALELFETTDVDGAILDIGMPDMGGMEVARRIRQKRSAQQLWLVALTGWGGDANRRLILESGFDEHLIKPVDLAALRSLLAFFSSRP